LLVTGDGQVFGGTLRADAVKLELSSGQVTSVPLSSVRRLGYRRRPDEPEEARPPAGKPLVMLRTGDRVAVEPPSAPLVVATCYGELKLDPRTVASVAFQSEEHGVHEVRLVDGSRFAGVVRQDRFELTRSGVSKGAGGAGGASVGFAAQAIKRIQFAPDMDDPPPDAPRLELSNGDVLVGGLSGRLTLETAFDAIDVDAAGLQGARQGGGADADPDGAASGAGDGDAANEVQLTLWDGTTVSGRVRGDAVDCVLRCGTSVRVPVGMVRRYTQPSPRPPEQVVKRIKAVVAELNADDWKARDAAARQLASIGPASAAVLRELRDDQPPEVRQRIDHVLASFEKKPDPEVPGSAPPAANAPADAEAPAEGPG